MTYPEEKRLKRLGPYSIKHSAIGWWVDGCCGFSVSSYCDTKKEAIEKAIERIEDAIKENMHPSWLY